MFDDLTELYQETMLEHSRRPRNYRVLSDANCTAKGHNLLCGDTCTVYIKMDGELLEELTFQGTGCAISKASASILTAILKGKTKTEVKRVFDEVHDMVTTGSSKGDVGDLAVMAGVRRFPSRVKCALLPWQTAMAAIEGRTEVITTESNEEDQ